MKRLLQRNDDDIEAYSILVENNLPTLLETLSRCFFFAFDVSISKLRVRETKEKKSIRCMWSKITEKFMSCSPMEMPPTHALTRRFEFVSHNVSRFYRCPSNFLFTTHRNTFIHEHSGNNTPRKQQQQQQPNE